MSSPRLRLQFDRLFEYYLGENSDVQLDDVTEILCCTRRNARMVLNKLQDLDWISWQPAAGRGKLSRLEFKRNKLDISDNLAKQYLDEGKVEQALAILDNDATRLTQLFETYLGVSHEEGQQVVRLPYYRQLANLHPHKPTRRSEQHIISHVFSGLTQLDKDQALQPDLAHHWEMLSPTHWRFYLRAGVRFHHGEKLTTENVIQSIMALKNIPLFEHIENVTSISTNSIDIHLVAADYYLPLLLTETAAKILPINQAMMGSEDVDPDHSFDLMPNGTGPYQVIRNDESRLVLKAFDHYFGYRPLLERVEVWVLNEAQYYMIYPSLTNPMQPKQDHYNQVELDPGCTYILLNRLSGLAKNDQWADYFAYKLNSFRLLRGVSEQKIIELGLLHAHGLKPGWHHNIGFNREQNIELPFDKTNQKPQVTIAYQQLHPLFPFIMKVIKNLLMEDGIVVHTMPDDAVNEDSEHIDLWLKPMGLTTHRDEGLQAWLLGNSDIEKVSDKSLLANWKQLITDWRGQTEQPFPAQELAKQLVQTKHIIPMFHSWLGVGHDHCGSLQNVYCNSLGWFDFSQVWIKPE